MGIAKMALNERTASYLAEEVRKAQLELETLNAQVREAEFRREAGQIKLEALQSALGPGAPNGGAAAQDTHKGQTTLFPGTGSMSMTGVLANAAGVTVGFRDAIRVVLTDAPKGLRPTEVYKKLTERGVVYKGKTDPTNRTGNELRRMVREGHARKRGKLYYALLAEQNHGGTTQ
jgi:hypothetical protein